MKTKAVNIAVILVAAVTIMLGLWFGKRLNATDSAAFDTSKMDATVFSQARDVVGFQLTDDEGNTVDNDALKGKWSLVFFGFTRCQSICPTTMSLLNNVYQDLQKDDPSATPPQVLFVSIDPKYDSPKIVKDYVTSFNPAFKGMTGDKDEVAKLAKNMNVIYMRPENAKGDDSFQIEHSGIVYVINPEGKMAALFNTPLNEKHIVADFESIRKNLS